MKITSEQAKQILHSEAEYEIEVTTFEKIKIIVGYSENTGMYTNDNFEHEYETAEDVIRDGVEFKLKKYEEEK